MALARRRGAPPPGRGASDGASDGARRSLDNLAETTPPTEDTTMGVCLGRWRTFKGPVRLAPTRHPGVARGARADTLTISA
jgi:hypothetical protein